MDKFITIEVNRETKYPVKVGHLCAEGVEDAYEQMGCNNPVEAEVLVFKVHEVNQLIIDLNKMARKV